MQVKKINPLLLLLLLNIIVCLCIHYPILGRMNRIMLTGGGDGIKNYFTYLYFIKYDFGTHFTGLNYPFGENIVFTDNMPALAWPIAKLKIWFPGIANYGLVLMHSTFIISYFVGSFFVYKILDLFGVRGWWAVASAVFIAYFSPQFTRVFGHFGLGVSCFFPMMIYWVMQYDRTTKIKYLPYIFCCTIVFTFLHVYYLAFAFVLILAYCFAYLVTPSKPFFKKVKRIAPLLIPVVSAIVAFKIYLKITDTVTDRPVYPIGYLGGGTTGPDILTSGFNFIGHYAFLWLFGGMAAKDTEGYTYLGFVTILTAIYLLYRIIKSIVIRVRNKKKIPTHPVRAYRKWLIVALVILLFSMGVPFVWGLDFLVDYFSVFRQFRTLGRFSWTFYYLIMIYASIFLYRWFVRMRLKGYRKQYLTLAILIVSVWLIEWNGYGAEIRRRSEEAKPNYGSFFSTENESWLTWLRKKGYDPKQFQAATGIPYFHIGSEKLGLQNNDYPKTMYVGTQLAMQTGLPMMDVMMSRTSWSQAFEQVRFYDGPFTEKTIATKLSDKPLLLFVNKNFPLSSGENYMLRYADFIGSRDDVDFYKFNIQKMLTGDKQYTDSCIQLAMQDGRKEGLLTPDNRFSYSQHFDDQTPGYSFCGKGGLPAAPEYQKLILDVPVSHPTDDTTFVFSTWIHCLSDRPEMPNIYFEELNSKGEVIYSSDYLSNHSTYITDNWYKAERIVPILKEAVGIKFYARGGKKEFIALDELLIQPLNSIYFYKANDTTLMLNNRPVKIKR
jgi:hypothetical protein